LILSFIFYSYFNSTFNTAREAEKDYMVSIKGIYALFFYKRKERL